MRRRKLYLHQTKGELVAENWKIDRTQKAKLKEDSNPEMDSIKDAERLRFYEREIEGSVEIFNGKA